MYNSSRMMKLFRITLLVLALLGYPVWIYSGRPCKSRKFNHESIVCVCDESYCDTFDRINRTVPGMVRVYESNRSGKRMKSRETSFGKDLPDHETSHTVHIDRTKTFQTIIGFGGSWSDAAAIGIGSLTPALRTTLLRAYFSDEGIEYSTARVVISGSDFSNRPYTYDDMASSTADWALSEWKLAEEDIQYKIPQMQEAQRHSSIPIQFIGSSWSPPAWMKSNGKLNNGGSLIDYAGSKNWQIYARYLLRFFLTYKAKGLTFWGMTIQNEPMTGWDPWFPWNTCGFNAEMERDFLKTDLGPIMEAGGFGPDKFHIFVLDHNRNIAEDWANVVFSDKEASRYAAGIAVHWYFYGSAGPYTVFDNIHKKFPDKIILATEACNRNEADEKDRIGLGKWQLAEEYAHDILLDLLHWVTGWTDWNMVLDMSGGPNWVGNNHSAPIIVNPDAGEFYKNVQFYAMAHFSKFLPPGTKRIAATPEVEVEGQLELGAFLRPDGGIVIVVINSKDQELAFKVRDSDVGDLKLLVAPHSFNTWIYYHK